MRREHGRRRLHQPRVNVLGFDSPTLATAHSIAAQPAGAQFPKNRRGRNPSASRGAARIEPGRSAVRDHWCEPLTDREVRLSIMSAPPCTFSKYGAEHDRDATRVSDEGKQRPSAIATPRLVGGAVKAASPACGGRAPRGALTAPRRARQSPRRWPRRASVVWHDRRAKGERPQGPPSSRARARRAGENGGRSPLAHDPERGRVLRPAWSRQARFSALRFRIVGPAWRAGAGASAWATAMLCPLAPQWRPARPPWRLRLGLSLRSSHRSNAPFRQHLTSGIS